MLDMERARMAWLLDMRLSQSGAWFQARGSTTRSLACTLRPKHGLRIVSAFPKQESRSRESKGRFLEARSTGLSYTT